MGEFAHLEKDKKGFGGEFLVSADSFFNIDADTSTSYYSISNVGENYSDIIPISSAVETDPQIRNPRRIHERIKFDIASRFQLSNIVLGITIPGNSDIEIGNVINVHAPLRLGSRTCCVCMCLPSFVFLLVVQQMLVPSKWPRRTPRCET